MSKENNHIGHTLTPEVIEKYLNGELSHQEMNAVEKLMLDSDFDAEAMEGFEATGPENMADDLAALESKLDQKTTESEKGTFFWYKIAASLIIVALSAALILNMELLNGPQKEMAESASKQEPKEADTTIGATDVFTDSSLLAINETPEKAEDRSAESASGSPAMEPSHISQAPEDDKKPEATMEEDFPAEETPPQATAITLAEADEIQVDQEVADEAIELSKVPELETEESIAAKLDGKTAGVIHQKDEVKTTKAKKETLARVRAATTSPIEYQTPHVITGKITSMEDGSALPGINVVIKGTSIGTVTDLEGEYSITIPQNTDPVLVISFIGLTTEEVNVAGKSEVDVQLEADVTALSEVVVTGYGISQDDSQDVIIRAKPITGNAEFKKYIENNLRYPSDTTEIKGKVVVEFNVLPNGELSNFKIIKSLGPWFDKEAIRVIQEGPAWKATSRNGVPEKDTVRVKVKFRQ